MRDQHRHQLRCTYLSVMILACTVIIVSCSSNPDIEAQQKSSTINYGVITGSIAYPGTYSYTEGGVVIDISLEQQDPLTGEILEVSHQSIRNPQRFPVNFTIRYDKADIQAYMMYSVHVEVRRIGESEPYLVSSDTYRVITGSNSNRADIQLKIK